MSVARWWRPAGGGSVACELCPRACTLAEGQRGFCGVRINRGGALETEVHGVTSGFCVDPVEKKPLYHFHPGARVLSFGTLGCNLDCDCCQNWHLSRSRDTARLHPAHPRDIVRMALAQDCLGVAFTYNEPLVSAEFCLDVAAACREAGLRTVAVSAGYATGRAREEFFGAMDAANVDLKGIREDFYRRTSRAELGPVLETLEAIAGAKRTWLEVTNLLIPGLNDGEEDVAALAAWVAAHLGPDCPLHLTAFHPEHRMRDRPPTPLATLRRARELAEDEGLRYVYTGNVRDEEGSTTWCPECGEALVERDGFEVTSFSLDHGRCPGCGHPIPGVFPQDAG